MLIFPSFFNVFSKFFLPFFKPFQRFPILFSSLFNVFLSFFQAFLKFSINDIFIMSLILFFHTIYHNRYRPIIHTRHFHIRPEFTGLHFKSTIMAFFDHQLIQRDSFFWSGRQRKPRPPGSNICIMQQ